MTEKAAVLVPPLSSRLGRWLASAPMLAILLITLLAAVGETLHSRVLAVGGATWPDYTKLRLIDKISAPNCQAITDVEGAVEQEILRRQQAAADDLFSDVFGGQAVDRTAVRTSVESQNRLCQEQWAEYQRIRAQDNWQVRAFATGEMLLSHLVTSVTGNRRVILGLMILFCAAAATLRREQIALRPVQTQRDELVSTLFQIVANSILMLSAWLYRQQEYAAAASGMPVNHLFMHDLFVLGFAGLTAISIHQLFNPRSSITQGSAPPGSWSKALLCAPLYAFMCIGAALNFASYGFYHGMLVYLNLLLDMAAVFLNVGLYVWVGVLLARTYLAQRVFDLVRAWHLPPKWLCVVMLILTAPPTAYTGASAVLILAAGPALYAELRRAGSSERLALATTAIAGSMGTMLRPCLLVLIVASVNGSVTTDELYGAGAKVLLVSLALFTLYVFLFGGKTETQPRPPWREAVANTLRACVSLLPYVLIFLGVVAFWNLVLGKRLDEFSAPAILPIAMLLILVYERKILRAPDPDETSEAVPSSQTTGQAILRSTGEAAPMIGALILLIALSMSTGGMIERSGVLELLPADLGSVWLALAVIAGLLVVVGMLMDPYGAVLLVNATLAPWAIQNGINPLHFWIVTLLAFEMGYLTPPVALNHLITRQVVGPPTAWESLHGTFWQRHFRIIFPILVMGSALLVVTFIPALWPGLLL